MNLEVMENQVGRREKLIRAEVETVNRMKHCFLLLLSFVTDTNFIFGFHETIKTRSRKTLYLLYCSVLQSILEFTIPDPLKVESMGVWDPEVSN